MKHYLLTILFSLLAFFSFAQSGIDSLPGLDTSHIAIADTISKDSVYAVQFAAKIDSFTRQARVQRYAKNPFVKFTNAVPRLSSERKWHGKEALFYCVLFIILFFALVKSNHSRYLSDLTRIFFRTTLRQRQIRDQLLSAPLPSLLLNIHFLLSGALFIALLIEHYELGHRYQFWLLYLYCIAGLLLVYVIKYITLKLYGLLLRVSEATETYIFIVFSTNKIIGIALLPLIAGIAFMTGMLYEIVLTLAIVVVLGLYVYRFYLSYISLHNQIKVGFLHFAIYLFAFEIAPLLLINKLLVRFFSETY